MGSTEIRETELRHDGACGACQTDEQGTQEDSYWPHWLGWLRLPLDRAKLCDRTAQDFPLLQIRAPKGCAWKSPFLCPSTKEKKNQRAKQKTTTSTTEYHHQEEEVKIAATLLETIEKLPSITLVDWKMHSKFHVTVSQDLLRQRS